MTAPGRISSRVLPSAVISTSSGLSRSGTHASTSPSGSSDGTSFMLCTAKSALPSATALSTSFSNMPFWSMAKSGRASVSPLVVMVTISYDVPGFASSSCLVTMPAWASERRLPRAATAYLGFPAAGAPSPAPPPVSSIVPYRPEPRPVRVGDALDVPDVVGV